MKLNFGPLIVQLSGVTDREIPTNACLFRAPDDREAEASYTFHFVDRLPMPGDDWQMVFRRHDIVVFRKGELEARLLAVGNLNACYALYRERNEREADVYFIGALRSELRTDTLFVSCLCLERPLSLKGCYILHCAFLDYRGQAVLFSGPSGIGKSTHADLWCRTIEGTKVINGDRALICPDGEGGYEVCGWPVCGSSGICLNERRRLSAIVFMEQAADNEIRQMTAMQHFKSLCSQVTVNYWNPVLTREALDRLLVLAGKTCVRTYACNMKPEAAAVLHRHLTEAGAIR